MTMPLRTTRGTLMEVARRCQVSQSTVSRVLNNSTKGRFSVSPEVRKRILEVARELNYRPNIAARNLTVSKTNLVAVLGVGGIWSDKVGPTEEAVEILVGLLDQAGYEICMQFISQRHGRFDPPPLRVDGILAVGASRPEDLEALEESGIPYVSLNGAVGKRGSLVAPDDRGGTFQALEYLVGLGHRRVAYMGHPSAEAKHPSVFERRDAFYQAASQMGFEPVRVDLPSLSVDQSWDPIYKPFLQKAVQEGGATAVLAYSHFAAMALLRTAHEQGVKVPEDFSLMAFNDAPVLKLFAPALSVVDLPAAQMGRAAAQLLLRQMRSETPLPSEHVRVAESVVVRESTAPPRR